MEIRKPQTLLGDLVDVRRTDLAAKAAHIGETQVIGDDDEEVGAFTHGQSTNAARIKTLEVRDGWVEKQPKYHGERMGSNAETEEGQATGGVL